jgi:hypothetical protein
VLLRRRGWHVNLKRVHRLYRLEGLQMRLKPPSLICARALTVEQGRDEPTITARRIRGTMRDPGGGLVQPHFGLEELHNALLI